MFIFKTILRSAIAVICTFALASCGGDDEPEMATTPPSPSTPSTPSTPSESDEEQDVSNVKFADLFGKWAVTDILMGDGTEILYDFQFEITGIASLLFEDQFCQYEISSPEFPNATISISAAAENSQIGIMSFSANNKIIDENGNQKNMSLLGEPISAKYITKDKISFNGYFFADGIDMYIPEVGTPYNCIFVIERIK